jgi:hypothetical protein
MESAKRSTVNEFTRPFRLLLLARHSSSGAVPLLVCGPNVEWFGSRGCGAALEWTRRTKSPGVERLVYTDIDKVYLRETLAEWDRTISRK